MIMKIGYGKLGRSMPLSLERCGTLGGDVEMASTIRTLAERNPEHTFVLIGRNDGSNPTKVGLPFNVINPWEEWQQQLLDMKITHKVKHGNLTVQDHLIMRDIHDKLVLPTILDLDHIIIWAGQHGTTNSPIPGVRDPQKLTKPYDWSAQYCSFLLRGINKWRDINDGEREEIWLNADPRNYLKLRDLKWPLRHDTLAQRNFYHNIKHYRYGDKRPILPHYGHNVIEVSDQVWKAKVKVIYSRLEINGLVPNSPFGNLISYNESWDDRGRFGLFVNEARQYVTEIRSRRVALQQWVMPMDPDWIHGTWTEESQKMLGRKIKPAPWSQYYPKLHSVRCTFTTPSSGSGWATTKPWEAFAAGTVCFFHPLYDDQDNILADAHPSLRKWLRVKTPADLKLRIKHLNSVAGKDDWLWLVRAQRRHFDNAMSEMTYAKLIEERMFGV